MTREQLTRTGQSYRERHERELLRQQQAIEYGDCHDCRWNRLIDYFSDDGPPEDPPFRCGHCDNCDPGHSLDTSPLGTRRVER